MNDINELRTGEIYVATIQIADEAPYHLILLPDRPKYDMTHQAATEWASNIGGELPNRPEQALLFAHQRDQFDGDWYWSNTLNVSYPDYVWYQNFINGHQHTACGNKLRARAIRREYF